MSKLTKKKTETLYAKMVREEKAMQIAAQYGLQYEVLQSIKAGCTPEEALREWDLVQLSLKNLITFQVIEDTSFLYVTHERSNILLAI